MDESAIINSSSQNQIQEKDEEDVQLGALSVEELQDLFDHIKSANTKLQKESSLFSRYFKRITSGTSPQTAASTLGSNYFNYSSDEEFGESVNRSNEALPVISSNFDNMPTTPFDPYLDLTQEQKHTV